MKTASVTVNWGDPSDTLLALHSLASMDSPPDLIICVDNGSPPTALVELRAGLPDTTTLIELEANVGVAAANNAGMDHALSQGVDWTLLLNNDATVRATCLDRCLQEVMGSSDIAIVGPAVVFAERPDMLWFAGGDVSGWFAYPSHPHMRASASRVPPSSDVAYISTCCALVSSAAFRDVGPFRADYFMYYDETEWCQRARSAGWRCRYIGEVLCEHAVSASGGRRGSLDLSEDMAYYLARNPLRFALETPEKLRRFTRVTGLLTVYASFNALRVVRSRRPPVARAYLQGISDGWKGRMGKRPLQGPPAKSIGRPPRHR